MKNVTALILMMAALMFTSISKADYTINRFPVYEGGSDQTNPDVDGDTVVWQSSDTIYWTQIGNPDPNAIAIDGDQSYPAVSDGVVVWYDQRDTDKDIYGYDIASQGILVFTENDGKSQRYPDISGDTVVYQDNRNEYYNLYAHPVGGIAEAISVASTHQYQHAIDGTMVVWVEVVGQILQVFVRDINTADPASQVSASVYGQWYPAVSGSVIVWAEDPVDGSGYNIYGYDLDDPGTGRFPICTDPGNQNQPAISGDIVVWQDESDGVGGYDIWAIDLAEVGGAAFEVSDGTGDNRYPAISGDTIVWQRQGVNWDIYGARLLTPSTITVTSPNGAETYLAASSMAIIWDSAGPVDNVLIEFSYDGGANWVEVETVPNTGSYLWDPIADVQSEQCLIAVSNVDDATAYDESDGIFTLYRIPDSVTVVSPDGGEQFLAGSAMDIDWTTVGEIANVSIEFSSDAGQNWQTVTASTPNEGAFTWASVTDIDSETCSVRIRDAANAGTGDVSDTAFTVFQCDAALTADLTGDCFVGLADFAALAAQWLDCGNPYDPAWCSP